MRIVFGDASYWIALLNPRDQWHDLAQIASEENKDCYIVTSEMVLVELLNHFAEYGEETRRRAVLLVRSLVEDSNVEIVPQTTEQLWAAVEYYEARPDQTWGLTDCASFRLMEAMGIREALSSDSDFAQAGFRLLL